MIESRAGCELGKSGKVNRTHTFELDNKQMQLVKKKECEFDRKSVYSKHFSRRKYSLCYVFWTSECLAWNQLLVPTPVPESSTTKSMGIESRSVRTAFRWSTRPSQSRRPRSTPSTKSSRITAGGQTGSKGSSIIASNLLFTKSLRIILGQRVDAAIAGSRISRQNGSDPLKFAVDTILQRREERNQIEPGMRNRTWNHTKWSFFNSRVPTPTNIGSCYLIRFENNFNFIYRQIVFKIIIIEVLASTQYTW